jgi:3-deoxy-D-manno-octulosonic-acid transferase
MWYLVYNIALILAAPVILLILLAKQRCRRGLSQRLGFAPKGFDSQGRGVLWVHAVSLGEVVAAAPLVRTLHARHPQFRIVVSTVTETGREAVEQRLAGIADHCYAPLDFPWVVSRTLQRLNPALFLCVETELWPNLLKALAQRGVPSILVNGRLSSHSYGRYRLIRPFIGQVVQSLALCLMQSERDAERIIALGASPARVLRTGSIKFDQPPPDQAEGRGGLSRQAIGVAEHEELLVAGSTHAGEEEALLSCYKALQREFPSLVLLLAPRHIERAAAVESVVQESGLVALRRSATETDRDGELRKTSPRVIILDTRGELATVYRYAALAFVGGTLVPVGGHNLLEPALWGKPVLFGPYTDHCEEVARLLIMTGGAVRVHDGMTLAAEMARLLRDRTALRDMGLAAQQVVLENRGALERSLERIAIVLDASSAQGEQRPHTRFLCSGRCEG